MNLSKLVLVILIFTTPVFAQDLGTIEVDVFEGFKPTIPEASRLNQNATFSDTIKKDRKQRYNLLDVSLRSGYKTKPLTAATVKDVKIPELYDTKIGLGLGLPASTQTNFIYNSLRSRDLTYGLILHHFSNTYDLAESSKSDFSVYAKKITSSHIFFANCSYDRRTALYYSAGLFEEENFRNRFAYTKFLFSAISKENSKDKITHQTTFFVSDLNEFSENQIHLSSNLTKLFQGIPFHLELEFNNYMHYSNDNLSFEKKDFQKISFAPGLFLNKFGFDFNFGLDFDFVSQEGQFQVFPQLKITKELVKNILLIYGGLRHTEQMNTLKSISDVNPYIHSFGTNQSIIGVDILSQELKITDRNELYIAMRNTLAKGEVLEGSISYGIIQNFSHFIGVNHVVYNRFQLKYLDLKQLHIDANYMREISSVLKVKINMDYYQRSKEVSHHPNLIINVSMPVNLRNKIKVEPSFKYIGERTAIRYIASNLSFEDAIYKTLVSQFHANLSLSYFYSQQLSAYLHLNNLTNSKQDIWMDYREIGFNFLLGLNYSF